MNISRRGLLGGAAGGVLALGVGVPLTLRLLSAPTSTGTLLTSHAPLPERFRRPLTLPPVLRPVRQEGDTDFYEITQRVVRAEILPGLETELWTYGGVFPGPTIESRRGRRVVINHVNELPVPTVVHLHGGRTPSADDGYPIDFIYPVRGWAGGHDHGGHDHGGMAGDTREGNRDYVYPLDQRAATLWYHDHRMDFTGPAVWKGLAGFHLHRDDEEAALGLPSGSRELPLMVCDRSFAADGSLLYPSVDATLVGTPGVTGDYVAGVLGDVMLVNGVPWPVAAVEGAQYRLRLLNACNARRLSLRLDPAPPGGLVQIGTDGGLLEAPVVHDHVVLASAERVDVVVDFSAYAPGTVVTVRNDLDTGGMGEVMQFRVGERAEDGFVLPDRLSTIEPLRAEDAVVTRRFDFRAGEVGEHQGWVIDGRPFSPDFIAATVGLGTVEVWELFADFHHPVHLHLVPFQVLQRGE